jgi:hypothetical protein
MNATHDAIFDLVVPHVEVPLVPPYERAATETLQSFIGDGRRLRTIAIDGEMVALVVTSKPTPSAPATTPTIHAGVEPEAVIQRLSDDVLIQGADGAVSPRIIVGDLEHRCWVVRIGSGKLVRFWMNMRDGRPNTAERHYVVRRDGSTKRLSSQVYVQTRLALISQVQSGVRA